MTEKARDVAHWLPYADLACAILAGALWSAFPQLGPWPLAVALAPWAVRFGQTGRLLLRTVFDLPLALFLLTVMLGVWAAYDRQAAMSRFWLFLGSVFLFYAFANAHTTGTWRACLIVALGVGIAFYYLATCDWELNPAEIEGVAQLGRALQAPLPAVTGPRVNSNEVGGILAVLLPFAGWTASQAWQRALGRLRSPLWRRWLAPALASGALAFMLFGLVMTLSRGAWIALAGTVVAAGLCHAVRRSIKGGSTRLKWACLVLLGLVLLAALGWGVSWSRGPLPSATGLFNLDTLFSRAEFQRRSLTLVRDYPFIGAGLGGFQMLYSTYILLIHVGFISHSHNLYLNVAIDQGLPGLFALLWMWGLFAGLAWRCAQGPTAARGNADPASPLVGIAAIALVTGLLHGLVDNALYGRGVLLLFLPLAFAIPACQERHSEAKRRPAWWLLACAGLILLPVLLWPGKALSLFWSNLGAVHQSQAELSRYRWPEWPLQDAVRRAVDLSRPVSEFERALALDPRNPTANRRLGMIELSLGEYEAALDHLLAAYAAEPESMTTQQLLGEALIANGRLEEGQALWAGVSNAQGQLQARAFWYGYIGDSERAAWVRQAASNR